MDEDDDDEGEIKPVIRTNHSPYYEGGSKVVEGCLDYDGIYIDIRRRIGEVWRNPLECNRKTCARDGTVIEEACPELVVPEGCIRIQGNDDEYQDFPYCCDRVACPGDEDYWEDDPILPPRCDDRYCTRELGEVWSEHKYGVCNRKRCERDIYNYPEVFEEKCPKLKIPKGCELEPYPDLTKEFPDCCQKVVCPPGHPSYQSGDGLVEETETINLNEQNSKSDDSHNGMDK